MTPYELFRALPLIGPFQSRQIANDLFTQFDPENKGTIDFEHFVQLVGEYQRLLESTKRSLEIAFQHLSLKYGASLDKESFQQVLRSDASVDAREAAKQLSDIVNGTVSVARRGDGAEGAGTRRTTVSRSDVKQLIQMYYPEDATQLAAGNFLARLLEGAPPIFSQLPPKRAISESQFHLIIQVTSISNTGFYKRSRLMYEDPHTGTPLKETVMPFIRVSCGNAVATTPVLKPAQMGSLTVSPLHLNIDWPTQDAPRLAAWVLETYLHVQVYDLVPSTGTSPHAELLASGRLPLKIILDYGTGTMNQAIICDETLYIEAIPHPPIVVQMDICHTDDQNPTDHRVMTEDVAFSSEQRVEVEKDYRESRLSASVFSLAWDVSTVIMLDAMRQFLDKWREMHQGEETPEISSVGDLDEDEKALRTVLLEVAPVKKGGWDSDPSVPRVSWMTLLRHMIDANNASLDASLSGESADIDVNDLGRKLIQNYGVDIFHDTPQFAAKQLLIEYSDLPEGLPLDDAYESFLITSGHPPRPTELIIEAAVMVPEEFESSDSSESGTEDQFQDEEDEDLIEQALEERERMHQELLAFRRVVEKMYGEMMHTYTLDTLTLSQENTIASLPFMMSTTLQQNWHFLALRANLPSIGQRTTDEIDQLSLENMAKDVKERLAAKHRFLRGRFRRRDFPILIRDEDGRFMPAPQFIVPLAYNLSTDEAISIVSDLRTEDEALYAQDSVVRGILDPHINEEEVRRLGCTVSHVMQHNASGSSLPQPITGRYLPTGIRDMGSMALALQRQVASPLQKALLLCSLLCGIGVDAYVAVGTDRNDIPAYWVVTMISDTEDEDHVAAHDDSVAIPDSIRNQLDARLKNPNHMTLLRSSRDILGESWSPVHQGGENGVSVMADESRAPVPPKHETNDHYVDFGSHDPSEQVTAWEVAVGVSQLNRPVTRTEAQSHARQRRDQGIEQTPVFDVMKTDVDSIVERRLILDDYFGNAGIVLTVQPQFVLTLNEQLECFKFPQYFGCILPFSLSSLLGMVDVHMMDGLVSRYQTLDELKAKLRSGVIKAIVASDPLSVKYRVRKLMLPTSNLVDQQKLVTVEPVAGADIPNTNADGTVVPGVTTLKLHGDLFEEVPPARQRGRDIESSYRPVSLFGERTPMLTRRPLRSKHNGMPGVGLYAGELTFQHGSLANKLLATRRGTSGFVPMEGGKLTGMVSVYDMVQPEEFIVAKRLQIVNPPVDQKAMDNASKIMNAYSLTTQLPARKLPAEIQCFEVQSDHVRKVFEEARIGHTEDEQEKQEEAEKAEEKHPGPKMLPIHIDTKTGQRYIDPGAPAFPFKRVFGLFNGQQSYCNIQGSDLLINTTLKLDDPASWSTVFSPEILRYYLPWQPAWQLNIATAYTMNPDEEERSSITLSRELCALVIAYRSDVFAVVQTDFCPQICEYLRNIPCAAIASYDDGEGRSIYLHPYHPDLMAYVPTDRLWYGRPFSVHGKTPEDAIRHIAASGILDCTMPGVEYALGARIRYDSLGLATIICWCGYLLPVQAKPVLMWSPDTTLSLCAGRFQNSREYILNANNHAQLQKIGRPHNMFPGDLQSLLSGLGAQSIQLSDAGETLWLSPLALLKMLKHCRAGVPMEVMGLMLGELVDELTINVVDVFAMPQSGTGQNVESIDEVFQTEMVDRLRRVGRSQPVVGWYHSHPGFGCWLSMVDTATQESMEKMDIRQVALVIDPIQSVRGKVMLDCFRCVPKPAVMQQLPFQEATSINGFTRPPQTVAMVRGLDKLFYSMPVAYQSTEADDALLRRMGARTWMVDVGPAGDGYRAYRDDTEQRMRRLTTLCEQYKKRVLSEGSDVAAAIRATRGRTTSNTASPSTEGENTPNKNDDPLEQAASAAEALSSALTSTEKAEKLRKEAIEKARRIFAHIPEAGHIDPERHIVEQARSLMTLASIQKHAIEGQVHFSYLARLEVSAAEM